jgi:hypothetical protein
VDFAGRNENQLPRFFQLHFDSRVGLVQQATERG